VMCDQHERAELPGAKVDHSSIIEHSSTIIKIIELVLRSRRLQIAWNEGGPEQRWIKQRDNRV